MLLSSRVAAGKGGEGRPGPNAQRSKRAPQPVRSESQRFSDKTSLKTATFQTTSHRRAQGLISVLLKTQLPWGRRHGGRVDQHTGVRGSDASPARVKASGRETASKTLPIRENRGKGAEDAGEHGRAGGGKLAAGADRERRNAQAPPRGSGARAPVPVPHPLSPSLITLARIPPSKRAPQLLLLTATCVPHRWLALKRLGPRSAAEAGRRTLSCKGCWGAEATRTCTRRARATLVNSWP